MFFFWPGSAREPIGCTSCLRATECLLIRTHICNQSRAVACNRPAHGRDRTPLSSIDPLRRFVASRSFTHSTTFAHSYDLRFYGPSGCGQTRATARTPSSRCVRDHSLACEQRMGQWATVRSDLFIFTPTQAIRWSGSVLRCAAGLKNCPTFPNVLCQRIYFGSTLPIFPTFAFLEVGRGGSPISSVPRWLTNNHSWGAVCPSACSKIS